MRRAFMTDANLLESLEGQQYLVLRPGGSVAAFYDEEQAALSTVLPSSITGPNTGHVTLRGFHEPERVAALKSVLAAWARHRSPVEMEVVGVDGFPSEIVAQAEYVWYENGVEHAEVLPFRARGR